MTGRITFGMAAGDIQGGLYKNYGKLHDVMNQVSTQKRIQRPSDDSVGTWQALRLRSGISSNDQYQRNISDGTGWLSVSDASLNTGNDVIQGIRQLGMQASNDTYGATERKGIQMEVRQLLEQMVTISNTNYNGRYIFSGNQTQIPPYDVQMGAATEIPVVPGQAIPLTDPRLTDSQGKNPAVSHMIPGSVNITGLTERVDYDVDYVGGSITFRNTPSVLAQGTANVGFDWIHRTDLDISGKVERETQQGIVQAINVNADDVFGTPGDSDSFASVIRLMEGLQHNDSDKLRNSIDGVDQALMRLVHAQTLSGAVQNRMDGSATSLRSANLELTTQQGLVEDVDLAQAATDLSQRQQIYEASLQVAAKIIQPTLMQFL
jgi:flagellar hook-associated protein 3 FlgL